MTNRKVNKKIEVTDKNLDFETVLKQNDNFMKKHIINKITNDKKSCEVPGPDKVFFFDGGDTVCKQDKNIGQPIKLKSVSTKKVKDSKENQHLDENDTVIDKVPLTNKIKPFEKETKVRSLLSTVEDRKKLREKYTLKLKSQNNVESLKKEHALKPSDVAKIDRQNGKDKSLFRRVLDQSPKREPGAESLILTETLKAKTKSNISKSETITDGRAISPNQKKLIVKTIMPQYEVDKIYKAVTFVEKKPYQPLQIDIPSDTQSKKSKNSKSSDAPKSIPSKPIVKEQQKRKRKTIKKRDKQNRLPSLYNTDMRESNISPPTEVAKWAPSSINGHTKPYYEAWINTTLAAISKRSKKDKLFYKKQEVIANFQRTLDQTPINLTYENLQDERYTGRIKVNR